MIIHKDKGELEREDLLAEQSSSGIFSLLAEPRSSFLFGGSELARLAIVLSRNLKQCMLKKTRSCVLLLDGQNGKNNSTRQHHVIDTGRVSDGPLHNFRSSKLGDWLISCT